VTAIRSSKGVNNIRGRYVEQWTVYWISAHFLVAATQFEEIGVDWRNWRPANSLPFRSHPLLRESPTP